MSKRDFISYLKTLKPEDWEKPATEKWTVKDVVAHMIGWERIDPQVIQETWRTKKRPWFYETDDFDDFNRKSVADYRGYTPDQLIAEWEKYQQLVQEEIDRIGEKKLRAEPSLFGWLFDQEEKEDGHYNHHLRQVKNAVQKEIN
ncbi:MAG: maleylpyruvate isomerase N-terminal domain-containing protein [Parcubacteria group bacterium]|nr:maleylpyruvate isomerase N-terminal domain-containing protein [Parcubacteria group bacterium]